MFDLRQKDLVNGRTYFDRMGKILFSLLGLWLGVFSIAFIYYNNKVTGISDSLISMSWGVGVSVCLLAVCLYFYVDFIRKLKLIPGKGFKEKVQLYFAFNKSFYININSVGIVSTLLYMVFNSGPLAVFNCFLVIVMSLEKPAEERFFRHLRLNKKHMVGFKDRPLFE